VRQSIFVDFFEKANAERVRHYKRAADDFVGKLIFEEPICVHLCSFVFRNLLDRHRRCRLLQRNGNTNEHKYFESGVGEVAAG
jgi:hypothetical protein